MEGVWLACLEQGFRPYHGKRPGEEVIESEDCGSPVMVEAKNFLEQLWESCDEPGSLMHSLGRPLQSGHPPAGLRLLSASSLGFWLVDVFQFYFQETVFSDPLLGFLFECLNYFSFDRL